jgi:hypothetical protein
MELQGKIKVLNETKTYGDKGFRKRELVITTEEQYPQSILIEFVQDKTDLLNAYKVGDNVKVGINIGGREWVNPQGETKYFNSITGWRIEKVGDNPGSAKPFEPAPYNSDDDHEDLPF